MCAGTSSSNDAYSATTAGFASPDVFQLPPSPPKFGLVQLMGRRSLAGDGPGCGKCPRRRTALLWRRRRTRCDAQTYHCEKRGCMSVVPCWRARRVSNLSCPPAEFASLRPFPCPEFGQAIWNAKANSLGPGGRASLLLCATLA